MCSGTEQAPSEHPIYSTQVRGDVAWASHTQNTRRMTLLLPEHCLESVRSLQAPEMSMRNRQLKTIKVALAIPCRS